MSIPTGSKGSGLAIAQPDRTSWDPNRGLVIYKVWESIDSADIEVKAAEARTWNRPYTIRSTGTKHTIEIETASSTTDPGSVEPVPIDRWEMPGNEIQKSIWEHRTLLGITARALNAARQHIAENKTYDELETDEATLWATLTTDQKNAIEAAYGLAERNMDHVALGQYVLRHVTNVGAGYSANISDSNVEKLYTTDQLLAEVTDPVLWIYPLPARMVWKIQNLAAPVAVTGFLWSWRKLPSTEATAANGRIEISTEYWLEQWSTWLYDVVT